MAGAPQGAAGGGGLTFIEEQNASDDATLDFTSRFADFRTHVFYIHNIIPATDSVRFDLRTSSDAGSTFDSGANDYDTTLEIVGAGTISTFSSEFQFTLSDVGSAASEFGISGRVEMYGTGLSERTVWEASHMYEQDDGTTLSLQGHGFRRAGEGVTGVRFLFSSGNIESGTIEHMGVN